MVSKPLLKHGRLKKEFNAINFVPRTRVQVQIQTVHVTTLGIIGIGFCICCYMFIFNIVMCYLYPHSTSIILHYNETFYL